MLSLVAITTDVLVYDGAAIAAADGWKSQYIVREMGKKQ